MLPRQTLPRSAASAHICGSLAAADHSHRSWRNILLPRHVPAQRHAGWPLPCCFPSHSCADWCGNLFHDRFAHFKSVSRSGVARGFRRGPASTQVAGSGGIHAPKNSGEERQIAEALTEPSHPKSPASKVFGAREGENSAPHPGPTAHARMGGAPVSPERRGS